MLSFLKPFFIIIKPLAAKPLFIFKPAAAKSLIYF